MSYVNNKGIIIYSPFIIVQLDCIALHIDKLFYHFNLDVIIYSYQRSFIRIPLECS